MFEGEREDARRRIHEEGEREEGQNGDGKWDTAGAAASTGRSSGDEVVTVRRWKGGGEGRGEAEERRWGGGGENLRRFHAWRAVRGGTGQPDRAASLAGCTEGRQLLAGLPPPRIIRDERERKRGTELKQETFREGDRRG